MNKVIMLVEDIGILRDFYRDFLEDEGYDVISAGDGREALEILERENPDLLLLDIGLPDVDGREVLALLLERGKKIKVIVLTSHRELVSDPLCRAANAFVHKSYDLTELQQKIRQVLKKGN